MTDEKKEIVKIRLMDNYKYEGDLIQENDEFLEILDYKSNNYITVNKKQIKVIERKRG